MTIQFEKICRTCMADNKTLIPIYSNEEESSNAASVVTMLKAFVHCDMADDRLPKMMCLTCVSEMNQAYAFKQKCERSETTLLSYIKQMEHVSVPENTTKAEPGTWSGDEIEDNDMNERSPLHDEAMAPESIMSEQIIYQCVNCSVEFESNEEIEQHNCHVRPSNAIVFQHTEAVLAVSFKKADTKDDDDELNGKMEKFTCNLCNGTFTSQRSLTLHTNSQKCLQRSFECDICQKVFSLKRYLVKHLHRMHQKTDEAKTESEGDETDARRKYKCDVCSKGFTMMSSLKDHERIHTGFRPFLCSTCGKGFTQASNLRQHVLRHSQNKQFKCSKCESAFVTKGELVTHDRTHTKDHPFVCDVCDTAFTTSSSLVKHRRIHTGEKPYGCDLCPLRFTALNTMKNHRRTHTGEKPYQCSVCNKGFSQRSDCVSHLRTHRGDRSFKCEHCKSTFRKGASLQLHKKKCKSDEVDQSVVEELKC